MRKNYHRELCEDLAKARNTIYVEVPLGSVFLSDPPRADVIVVKPSYTQFCLDIYEVRYSRADFLKDLRSEKWRKYLDYCHRFYFAMKSGIIKIGELPREAGLIVRYDKDWKITRLAKKREVVIPDETLLSMLFFSQKIRNHLLAEWRRL